VTDAARTNEPVPQHRRTRSCAPSASPTSGARVRDRDRALLLHRGAPDEARPRSTAWRSSRIGCSGRVAGYVRLDSFHTTHGRAIPFATGLKLATPT